MMSVLKAAHFVAQIGKQVSDNRLHAWMNVYHFIAFLYSIDKSKQLSCSIDHIYHTPLLINRGQ